ncbi:unnamed protein product [Arctia plantaginis]|uniref:Uncharacterized protein n=1 Tax=Arctia plantaginis TaxID=874455 RepID=A0A8S0ZFH7_ARCPL|nr:unnamed protein product [Arctia plantaginis]
MDYPRRRGRRRRSDTFASLSVPNHSCDQQSPRQWCFTNSVTSFLILSSLIGIIYLMLDYHCYSCSKVDASALVKTVEQISKKVYTMQDKYYDLHTKILRLSQELPKLESQISILEAFANTAVQKEMGWDPKLPLTLSNLDELLKKTILDEGKNNSKSYMKCSKCSKKSIVPSTLQPIVVNQD